MALKPIDGLSDNVIGLKAVGRVSADDYREVLTPAVERATAGGRRARLLLDLGDEFEGYDLGAVFADAGLGMGHLNSFEKLAVVTDTDWVNRAVHLFGPLIPSEVRVFPSADSASAKEWVAG